MSKPRSARSNWGTAWKAEDALSTIIELRFVDLVAGQEMSYQLTENCLDQPIGERLLVDKEPLADRRLARAAAIVVESAAACRALRPARRHAEQSVHTGPAELAERTSKLRRRGFPLLRQHDAPPAAERTIGATWSRASASWNRSHNCPVTTCD
jgi:hypothetical protein